MVLDNHMLRLIAVGASVTANCLPCLEANISKAVENGAVESEIEQALKVGRLVRQGAATKVDDFALSRIHATPGAVEPARAECGCG
ncbi:MAG TPA: carboxymuconolactone decarboxylase family protein [Anaerolineales bacterium]|nr:carboxymuconolactone decarboxylase family protein [Anaerolineales bacterium]